MSRPDVRPPRVAEWLLSLGLPGRDRYEVLGDMAEQYRRRARHSSRPGAYGWYWRHALETPIRLFALRVGRGLSLLELRHAVRALRASPGFTLVAVLSLGLGIGANTAIYSSMRALLYTELPVERADELAFIYHERPREERISQFASGQAPDPESGVTLYSNISYRAYESMRDVADVEIAAFTFLREVAVAVDDRPAVAGAGQMVSGNYFSTLRPAMHLGRPISPGASNLGGDGEAVLSYSFWRSALGGDPDVLNKTIRINNQPFVVVGVTGPGFVGMSPGGFFGPTDITVPFSAHEQLAPRWAREDGSILVADGLFWVRAFARQRPGTPVEPLREATSRALQGAALAGEVVAAADVDALQVRFLDASRGLDSLRSGTEQPLRVLSVVAGFVLLIACLNVANLLLARGAVRQREIAVRRALGAGRARVLRLVFLESLLVAFLGGTTGLLFAVVASPMITAAISARLGPIGVSPELDFGMLAIAAAASTVAALLAGTLPALRLSRTGPADSLATRGATDATGSRVGRALIALQVAVSIPLIVGAGLFIRTVDNLADVDLGFDPDNLVLFQLDPELVTDDVDEALAIIGEVVSSLEGVPGVETVTVLGNALLSGWVSNGSIQVEQESARMYWNRVGDDALGTMGIEVLAGRQIESTDVEGSPPVAVVNATAEREYFGGRALGRSFQWGGRDWEIVGVAADSRYRNVRQEVPPTFFYSYQQRPSFAVHVVMRTALSAGQLTPVIQETVAGVNARLPVVGIRTQREQLRDSIGNELVFAQWLAGFSGFALVLACVGLYGVTAYAVARRRAELGVRIALGAGTSQIVRLVLGSVLGMTTIGVAGGLLAAYWLGPLVESLLYGIAPGDAAMMLLASALMAATGLIAAWRPAMRAASTDAAKVLSED